MAARESFGLLMVYTDLIYKAEQHSLTGDVAEGPSKESVDTGLAVSAHAFLRRVSVSNLKYAVC